MRIAPLVTGSLVIALLAGCAPQPATGPPTASGGPLSVGPVQPTGEPTIIASGLNIPWSIIRLASGSTLVSERNTALIKEIQSDGTIREAGTIPGVVPEGEGGLLGIEYVDPADASGPWLYAYFTAASDNRIVRFALDGDAGDYSLGAGEEILTGLAKAPNHDGGRIKLGPDGMLYATVGDAGNPDTAQDKTTLNGKILRLELDGSVPADNPTAHSLVYSMGHRNPQGLAWDSHGQLWESELGQDIWDEFNRIEAGGNYGWPIVEGIGTDSAFINPIYEWPTSEASPSGLAFTRNTFFMAALRGQRMWTIYPGDATTATAWFTDVYGRIRDIVPGPDGSVWIVTNNTDGRGSPVAGDDKILQVELTPVG
jgi:glucose/arabinose dehydrogenase